MVVKWRRVIDNDEWESLAVKEGRGIVFLYRLTRVIRVADYSHPYS